MLPPKEEGEAAHLLYPEDFTPTPKSVPANPFDQETPSPGTKAKETHEECAEQAQDSDSSDPPESPQNDTSTSLVILDSETDKPGQSTQNEIEIVQVLKNLENVKTPEPSEMEGSIVRASFVDFSAEDGPSPGEELLGEEGEDSKEFSLTLNPDLPKIRAQQIQNWLEFEKDQQFCHDENNNLMMMADSETSSMLGDSIEKPVNISQDFDLDSLSEAGQVTEESDGMGRRVRFLTDPEGNILISVYLTKLVQLLLSILKLVSAGYVDFTSNPHSLPASSTLGDPLESLDFTDLPPNPPSDSDFDSDSSSLCHSDESDIYTCHFNETDDFEHASGEEEAQQANKSQPEEAATIPEAGGSKPEEASKFDEIDIHEKPGEEECMGTQAEPVRVIEEVKKVIGVDPSLGLNTFEDGEEDAGSDTETLSTSSCSSMIEVIPKEKQQGELQFIKDVETDGNNNELKIDTIYLDDPEIKDKSITCYEFQPEKEIIPSAPSEVEIARHETGAENSEISKDTTLTAQAVENGDKTSGEVASPPVEVQSEDKNQPIDLLKFNPIIEQEHHQTGFSSNKSLVDVNNGTNEVNNNGNYNQQEIYDDYEDPEKQLVSLCIEEEPISAVALTIAKWESFSKKQQQMEQSDRSNIITKGKVHLQSYTNNANIHPGTINTNGSSAQMNGKQVMPPNFCSSGKGFQLPSPSSGQGGYANHSNGNINKSSPGWNSWSNNKTNEMIKNGQDDEEAIYAQPNSQAGSITTSLANPSAILRAYPKPNSRGEIINWFKEGEIHRSGILLSYGPTNHNSHPTGAHQPVTSPVIVSWFFGLITRQQAEELLHGQPTGTFLVRISTRIWGYTLSYQFNNKTKHFLISAINPAVPATLTAGAEANNGMDGQNGSNSNGSGPQPQNPGGKKQLLFPFSPGGRYAFIGTNMTPYTTLTSLIRHHSHAPITKAGGEKLTLPCPSGPKILGLEYVFK